MSEVAIRLEGISKKYTIGKEKDGSLRGTLSSLFSKSTSSSEDFWALKDVSFEVKKGDVVGIIGKNGAGKSTLLKILSQITRPTEGKIEINGRIASLLEVGTGFHPELTGRENIYLNGTILGMTRKEVQSKFDEIVAFSGIEKFIDTPVKHYSSGMYVRLAFAVAAHLEPEILIIDEVLAVGDAEFQKKCLGKMKDVAGEGRTVLFVSHDLAAVKSLCNRGVLLENGFVVCQSNVDECIEKYISSNIIDSVYKKNIGKDYNSISNVILSVTPLNSEHQIVTDYKSNEKIKLRIDFKIDCEIEKITIGVALLNELQQKIFTNHYEVTNYGKENHSIDYIIPNNTLCSGSYSFDVALFINKGKVFEYLNDICPIKIIDYNSEMNFYKNYGSVNINCEWYDN
ncbi:MAG: ABC transporter ATP-binding protein [Crocinitomicaceae bacterium]